MERCAFEGTDWRLSVLLSWIYGHALGGSLVSGFSVIVGGYTVVDASIVLIESDERGTPWVVYQRHLGVEKSVPRVCEKHQDKRRETKPSE